MSDKATTVRVRIAVAVDHTGDWSAGGMRKYAEKNDDELRECAFIDDMMGEPHWYWVEADVPIPEIHQAKALQGDVSDGE